MAEGKDHTYTVRHPVEDLQSGHYEAMFSAKNNYGWSPTSFVYTFSLDEFQSEGSSPSQKSLGKHFGGLKNSHVNCVK